MWCRNSTEQKKRLVAKYLRTTLDEDQLKMYRRYSNQLQGMKTFKIIENKLHLGSLKGSGHSVCALLITSWLEYCNVLYGRVSWKSIWTLQLIQNVAARVLTGRGGQDYNTNLVRSSSVASWFAGPNKSNCFDLTSPKQPAERESECPPATIQTYPDAHYHSRARSTLPSFIIFCRNVWWF